MQDSKNWWKPAAPPVYFAGVFEWQHFKCELSGEKGTRYTPDGPVVRTGTRAAKTVSTRSR